MPELLFGPYQPDRSDLNDIGATVQNVVPMVRGYGPLRSPSPISTATSEVPLTGFTARTTAGSFVIFVGTATKLWRYNTGTQGWDDVSRLVGGAYLANETEPWAIEQFGANVYASTVNDEMQFINVDSGTNFALLTGTGTPPKAGSLRVIGDFLVAGRTASQPNRIRWSGINAPDVWTSGVQSSDFQDFQDGGVVKGIAGYDAGYVLQANAIRRMIFTPGGEPDWVFRFEKIENARGCPSSRGYASVGPSVFFVAQDGFYRIGPDGIENIGFGQVNDTFLANIAQSELTNVVCAADPVHSRVHWSYKSNDAATAWHNKMLIYDWAFKKWAPARVEQYYVFPAAVAGITLEGLDALYASVDDIPYSLDSSVWAAGAPVLASLDSAKKLAFYQGPNLEATLATGEIESVPGRTALVTKVRPLTDAPNPVISISSRRTLQEPVVTSGETAQEVDGSCAQRVSARYHRFRKRIPAGSVWTYSLGVDPDARPQGGR